jgi:Na+-driven multidrug efflux pump
MCICSIIALIPFLAKKTLLRFVKPRFHFSMLRQIVACGSPVFLSNIAGRVTSIVMNVSLMTLGVRAFGEGGGTTAVAVYAILMYASDLCWPLLYGISDSLAPALGYNWGARNYARVKKIVRCAFIGTSVVGLLSTALLFFCPATIASLYAKAEDALLLENATRAIRFFCLAYLFRWFAVTTQGFLSAIEKPVLATLMSVGTALVFPLLMLAVLWPLGLTGIWLNFTGVNALAALLGCFLLLGIRKEIRRREKEPRRELPTDASQDA